jgi:hypothetical protein
MSISETLSEAELFRAAHDAAQVAGYGAQTECAACGAHGPSALCWRCVTDEMEWRRYNVSQVDKLRREYSRDAIWAPAIARILAEIHRIGQDG